MIDYRPITGAKDDMKKRPDCLAGRPDSFRRSCPPAASTICRSAGSSCDIYIYILYRYMSKMIKYEYQKQPQKIQIKLNHFQNLEGHKLWPHRGPIFSISRMAVAGKFTDRPVGTSVLTVFQISPYFSSCKTYPTFLETNKNGRFHLGSSLFFGARALARKSAAPRWPWSRWPPRCTATRWPCYFETWLVFHCPVELRKCWELTWKSWSYFF